MNTEYESLKEIYPEYISLDQFYKICRLSKRGAVYLLEHGFVPYINTGKKTWKYVIRIDDVISYLNRQAQEGRLIPKGAIGTSNPCKQKKGRQNSFSNVVKLGDEYKLREYFNYIYKDCNDALSTSEVALMIGFHISMVRNFIKSGHLKALLYNRIYLIPKEYLFDFIASPRYINSVGQSKKYKKILRGYVVWQNAQY